MRLTFLVILIAAVVGTQEAAIRSPEVGPDRRVTFRLSAPAAKKVQVVNLAPSPSQARNFKFVTLPMRMIDGIWTATSDPLSPDIYAYQFAVDGRTINDPLNPKVIVEFDGKTSTFSVPGALWTTPGAPRGAVSHYSYRSAAVEGQEDYYVYTPPGYDAKRQTPYPVLYLLHGGGDVAYTWVTNGGVAVTMNNLLAAGNATPMVIVMPLCYGSPRRLTQFPVFERALLQEIVPRVERSINVSKEPAGKAIAGVSIGGGRAISIGLRHPESFAWVGSFSGDFYDGLVANPDPVAELVRLAVRPERFALIYVSYGGAEAWSRDGRRLADLLAAQGAKVSSTEVPNLGHVWPVWRQSVAELLQKLFR